MEFTPTSEIVLKATDLVKSYGTVSVLKGIDIEVTKGEIVSIVGASGAGKSTLLHILGTLDNADGGKVFFNGKDLTSISEKNLAEIRNRHMGFVFQFHNLLPEFTALENVCLPGLIGGKSFALLEKRAKELLDYLGVSHRAANKPGTLSGGEQQRVAVARALINQPEIIFADEPSGNLDSQNAEELHRLFFQLSKELKQTFVIVTHNDKLASGSDRKIELKDGLVLRVTSPSMV
ncbi:MAG TPA: ABC transporter ATP-binding protein [Cytophagaceae bacterium]|jgi:lipoprotein-releasing system ATP-binding protein|nr:ABC transporter ATP-binding protein [Cytophagaceae bacterium]